MTLTTTQLSVFYEIINENNKLSSISDALNKNKTHISEILSILIKEKLIHKNKNQFIISNYPFTIKLRFLLLTNKNLINILCDSGIDILLLLLNKSTIKEIATKSGLKEITIRKFLQKSKNMSIISKENSYFSLNEEVWGNLKEFLLDYKSFQDSYDNRIPLGSVIYFKNKKEIIFSYNKELDSASPTAFTIFKKYDILIFSNVCYYYLPKKPLTKKDILEHTLKIVSKTMDFRDILHLSLFYIKYKSEFKDVHHEILANLNKILIGEKVNGYPPLKEIKEKLILYNIRM